MAKDGKTEKATPRKKQQAKEKGNVPQSKELALFLNLISFTIFLAFFGSWFIRGIMEFQRTGIEMIDDDMNIMNFISELAFKSLNIMMPVAALALVFILLNYIVQVRFLFAPKTIKPDLKKINPKQYFSNLFKRKTFVQILKQLVIVTILGYIVYVVFYDSASEVSFLIYKPWEESLYFMWSVFKDVIYKILFAMLVIGIIDFFYERWEYEDNLKMKKSEVQQDRKDTDGDPHVKMRQNQRRMALLKKDTNRKMKEEVTFLTTNPTHYAVGVFFKPGKGNPRVVLKGVDHMALYMKEVAKKHDVAIYEDPPLARELYAKVLENEEIPEEMWGAIALAISKLLERKDITL